MYRIIKLFLAATLSITFLIFFFKSQKNISYDKKTTLLNPQKNYSPKIILNETELCLFEKNNKKKFILQAKKSKLFPRDNRIESEDVVCKLEIN